MSKLSEKIRRVTTTQPGPIGFGSSKSGASATLVLAATAADASSAAERLRDGADVAIAGSAAAPASPAKVESKDAIVGAWVAGVADNESKAFNESGYDFVVFDPDTASATSLLDESIGYVLRLPTDLTDNEIRTLEAFQLDAIHVGRIDGVLTVRRQIDLRRIYAMTRKPLMAEVDPAISVAALQALRDTNIVVVTTEGAENVARLRKTIDALPPRARRKDGEDRPTPLVPRAASAGEEDSDEDEEVG